MLCHICQAEAVSRCYNCGQLVCAEHDRSDHCAGCSTAFAVGDPRTDRISVKPMTQDGKHGWWRPQEAEAYVPPACYECKGLARRVCHNCRATFCPDHAGPNGLCKACGQSANLGIYVFAGMMALLVVIYLFTKFYG